MKLIFEKGFKINNYEIFLRFMGVFMVEIIDNNTNDDECRKLFYNEVN
jgi:hypothetical protein